VEDVDEDEGEVAPGSRGGGGGGGKTIASDTSGSAGSPLKSGNVDLRGATYGEGTEDAEDADDNMVGVKLNIVEGCDIGSGLPALALALELPVLLALNKVERCWTGIGTRTDGFFTFFCDDDDDEDTEDRGDGDGNKGEKEISGEIGIALRGLSLPLLAFDV